jgi:HCOMODA/2-hydroxy-3-carboxy-muconic semialdehyde decarboxylase
MRGHGCVVAESNLREAVLTAIYLKVNAQVQSEAMRLGDVTYLSRGEIEKTSVVVKSQNSVNRMWEYWRHRAAMDESAVTRPSN